MSQSSSGYALLSALIAVAIATPASAQARFEFGPLVAAYSPMSSFEPAAYYSTALPNSPGNLGGTAWGGQARLWLSRRLGVQVQAAEARSSVGGGPTPGGNFAPTGAQVVMASAQGLYRPALGRIPLWLSAGAGVVHHGGVAYSRYGSPTQMTGALGVGSAIPLWGGFRANLGLTTLLYHFDLKDSTGVSLERGFMTDALLSLGVTWSWHSH
jgi:hypothetical protein